jgi:hypothetical protein
VTLHIYSLRDLRYATMQPPEARRGNRVSDRIERRPGRPQPVDIFDVLHS